MIGGPGGELSLCAGIKYLANTSLILFARSLGEGKRRLSPQHPCALASSAPCLWRAV
jgi:hypothetical protein